MTKDIRDYLHLYLGCECFNHLRLLGVEGNAAYVSHPATGRMVKDINYLKPILRPLSDMTEEERIEIGIYYESCHCSNPGTTCKDGFHPGIIEWEPESVIKALSKGFDLFGLIEAGLAIDKTKIK